MEIDKEKEGERERGGSEKLLRNREQGKITETGKMKMKERRRKKEGNRDKEKEKEGRESKETDKKES